MKVQPGTATRLIAAIAGIAFVGIDLQFVKLASLLNNFFLLVGVVAQNLGDSLQGGGAHKGEKGDFSSLFGLFRSLPLFFFKRRNIIKIRV